MEVTPHAQRQAAQRDIPLDMVVKVIRAKLGGRRFDSAAVKVGTLREERGSLIGSNGDQVWAVLRGGDVVTIMLRRSDQPATPSALRVRHVAA